MKSRLKTVTLCVVGLWLAARSYSAPIIQFDQVLHDFGKTSRVESVSGIFKFRNAGDSVLILEAPKPSCGCTVTALKTDTLPPGAAGELPYTLNLGPYRSLMEKHIAVRSNDPRTPEVLLSIRVDYTPLFEFTPVTLALNLAFGLNEAAQVATLKRTDGQPLRIARIEASKPWIKAALEPVPGVADPASARIRVVIQRDGPPRRYSEYVHVYSGEQPQTPISSLFLSGSVQGEVVLSPEALYWNSNGTANPAAGSPEAQTTRRVTIRSVTGRPLELKNLQSTLQGIRLEFVPKEAGRIYELVARLDQVPASTVSGSVSFETSVAAQSRIEVPVIVNVFKP